MPGGPRIPLTPLMRMTSVFPGGPGAPLQPAGGIEMRGFKVTVLLYKSVITAVKTPNGANTFLSL